MHNKIVGIVLTCFSIIFVIIVVVSTSGNTQCIKQKEVSDELINGKVAKVFIDSTHHNYETVELIVDGETRRNYFLLFEKSGLYNHLLPGDSIFKKENSLELSIVRGYEKIQWTLDYGCKN